MKKIFLIFVITSIISFLLFPSEGTSYYLTVEYNGHVEHIEMKSNPSELISKCEADLMYFHPWNKHFDETPSSPGYWKVRITDSKTLIHSVSIWQRIFVSIFVSGISVFLLWGLGAIRP